MTIDPIKSVTFLYSIVENIPNMVFLKDAEELRFVLFNKAGEELLGFKSEDLIGKNDYDFFPKAEADFFTEKDRQVLSGKQLVIIPEEPIHTAKGERILRTKKIPILDEQGTPRFLLGISEDITEQRKQDKALKYALGRAEQAARAKALFLANMSHEIRTPMNGITGMVELLEKTELTAEQREYVLTAQTCCDMLLALVSDILDYSKIDAGKLELESVVFDLRELLDDVTRISLEKARRKGLNFIVNVDRQVAWQLKSDRKRLLQVLVNLVDNAVKFTSEGHVLMKVEQDPSNADSVLFAVEDTGRGIAKKMQARILEPFKQVDESTHRGQSGTGLGLSIVCELLKIFGSQLSIESAAHQGSSFKFSLATNLPGVDNRCPALLEHVSVILVGMGAMQDSIAAAIAAYRGSVIQVEALVDMPAILQQNQVQFVCYDFDQTGLDAETVRHDWGDLGDVKLLPISRRPISKARLVHPVRFGDLIAALQPVPVEMQPTPNQIKAQKTVQPNLKKRLLIVEDNAVNRRVLGRFLEKCKLEFDTAENGRIALDLCSKATYDLIFMDCQMPVLDGFETTRALRVMAAYKEIPIIAVTANATDEYREACLACGMTEYVAKPILAKKVAEIVTRYLVD